MAWARMFDVAVMRDDWRVATTIGGSAMTKAEIDSNVKTTLVEDSKSSLNSIRNRKNRWMVIRYW